MCGIAAILGRGWEKSQLDAMIRSQAHRGPDADGSFVDPSGLAGLGHNRLSILDLSPAGRQPMSWAAYLGSGMHDLAERTFWSGIRQVPPGHCLTWSEAYSLALRPWYHVAEAVLQQGPEERSEDEVGEELLGLLEDSVRLRF